MTDSCGSNGKVGHVKPFLCGQETEYGVTGRSKRGAGRVIPPESVLPYYLRAARTSLHWMQDARTSDGIYLQNGARLYGEINGHPEYCTPECTSPVELAAHDLAGEWILGRLAQRVAHQHRIRTAVVKSNTGFLIPRNATYAMHESYSVWTDDIESAAEPFMPHLVSRIVYAGAGCLSEREGCDGFELSQRARHIKTTTSSDTTSSRPLFCTRIRKHSDFGYSNHGAWVRMHQISADGKRCAFATYCTFGTTGILVHLLSHGIVVGKGLMLKNPVSAMQTISCDPMLRTKVGLVDGRQLTALEIQQSYIDECESALRGIESPDWIGPMMRHWQTTIADLARDPLHLADRLDIYLLQMILSHEIQRAGYTWSAIHGAQRLLLRLRRAFPDPVIRALVADDDAGLSVEDRVGFTEARGLVQAAGRPAADQLRFLVRLKALEVNVREIGGLVDQLRAAGKVDSVILTDADIERAVNEPPAGRAALRGQLVKDHHNQSGWICDWSFVGNSSASSWYDLVNPFATKVVKEDRASESVLLDLPERRWRVRI